MNAKSLFDVMNSASFGPLCLETRQLKCRVDVAGASTLPEELGIMMDDMTAPGSDSPMQRARGGLTRAAGQI
jgi:hypothetical protein